MTTRIAASMLVVIAASAGVSPQERRAFEIADYYRTAFVGAPEISPDGLRVAVAVTPYELEKGESWSEIWMMGEYGSNSRQMTQGRHHDSSPSFSPDGSLLAFESDRAGELTQLIVLPNAGHWPGWYEMAFYYLAHLDWFNTWLGGGEPPWDVERFLRNQVFGEGVNLGAPPPEGAGPN